MFYIDTSPNNTGKGYSNLRGVINICGASTGLRSFLPERFLSGQGAGSFSRENGEESEGTGRNMLYYLSRKTPTHPTAPLRNKRDKGRNRNITEEERKGEREKERKIGEHR